MRKSIILVLAGLAFLAGCKESGNKASNVPATPKWKGAPYHLAFDTQAAKPGVLLPVIKYTANPDMLETRATLIVRYDSSSAKKDQQVMDQIIMDPVDISGAEGALPADYMDTANKGLSRLLSAYCMKGKIKVTVALARSSLTSSSGDSEINSKLLSDWLPIEVNFKNPHANCK